MIGIPRHADINSVIIRRLVESETHRPETRAITILVEMPESLRLGQAVSFADFLQEIELARL